jgi:hypothetical protein
MELRRNDSDGLTRLASLWKTTPGAEFEAMLTGMELTSWQDVIQYLRGLGMREIPQIVKLNICLSNDIRITLEGAGVIQAYCRDNRLGDKPFKAMLKENIDGAVPVNFSNYAARAKLKREIPLAMDDARVKEVLSRWDSLGKHFRSIQRFEFVAPGKIPLRFDVSIVRENAGKPARTFQEARVTSLPPRYEVEVELTAAREGTEPVQAMNHIVRGLGWLLQGRQRSYVLSSNAAADYVRDSVSAIFGSRSSGSNRANGRNRVGPTTFRYPGPQPATLERRHMQAQPEPGVPHLLTMAGGYNVTDKADGLRCLLFVSENGKIFLVDGGGRVYATGKQADAGLSGLVLDGEWIRRDRKGATVSHFYAFDIMAEGGSPAIAAQPFMVAGAMLGSAAATGTRMGTMAAAISKLESAKQTVRGVPPSQNLQVGMKTFRTAEGANIFRESASTVLEDAKLAPYNTDGLIFTPNAMGLPLGRGTWYEQLKWKPPHENTIDFLVVVDRERNKDGTPTALDAIGTKYREDSGQTVRYKTLRLFVGSNKDQAFADPRRTVTAGEPLPMSLDEGEWREVEFRPTDPRDPMAAICYVGVGEGAADPARATTAAVALDTDMDFIRCTRTGDIIQSDMIVEMAYHPERTPGWRWEPTRVRHDKTERWLAQQAGHGRKGGTMNADWVANSIWNTLHNPVTEEMVRSGKTVHCAAPAALVAQPSLRRAPARDLMKAQCLRNFHDYVKKTVLYGPTLKAGVSLCDLAMGRGEDIAKWIAGPVSFAFGCDVDGAKLNDPVEGAYRRLMDKMIALGGREAVPPMIFAQADAARRLTTGDAAMTEDDRTLLQQMAAKAPFDVVSCMFALHYMFRDENTLAGFLMNLADTVKVGGYFIGCAMDGDAIARLFTGGSNSVSGRDGATDAWLMTKRYGSGIGSIVPPSAAGLGLAVDVDFISVGESHTEYLISWPYMQARMAEVGLELVTPAECVEMGIPASSQMFSETWSGADGAGENYAMTDAIRKLSFLNRWWVFKRRSDLRPTPPLEAVAPPAALTEQIPLSEAPALGGAPAIAAAALSAIPEGTEAEAVAEEDKIQLEELAEAEAEAEAAPAAPINKTFLVTQENKAGDKRLGDELTSWPSYMTLGTPVELSDVNDPAVKYPSVEAAVASAKYRIAGKPEIGVQFFRVEGAIHQKFEQMRKQLRDTGAPMEAITKSYYDEMSAMRVASGPAKMKTFNAIWDAERWNQEKIGIYKEYIKQRYNNDPEFALMINAIKAISGSEILFANGKEPVNELGVGVLIDGTIVGGDNKLGKIMRKLGDEDYDTWSP